MYVTAVHTIRSCEQVFLGRPAKYTSVVTVGFQRAVLERLRALAARKRIPYQRLLKQFVVERLAEEER